MSNDTQSPTLSEFYNQIGVETYHDGGLVGDGGDDCLYLGMMAAVTDPFRNNAYITALFHCQSKNGQMWRNPVYAKKSTQYNKSYSKDMLAGFLLGVISSEALLPTFINFIEYLKEHQGLMFPESVDNRNKTNSVTYAMFIRIFRYHGFTEKEIVSAMGWKMYTKGLLTLPFTRFITFLEGLYPRLGYQAHLVGVQLFAMKKMGVWGFIEKKTAQQLVKLSGGNGFFHALAGDREEAISLLVHTQFYSDNPDQKTWPFGLWQVWLANPLTSKYAGIFLRDYIVKYCLEDDTKGSATHED